MSNSLKRQDKNQHCGFLYAEEREGSGQYVRRYLMLDGAKGHLQYYLDHPINLQKGNVPLSCIQLQYVSLVSDTSKTKPKPIYSFIVIVAGKKHSFRADSHPEVERWVTVLNNICKITVPKKHSSHVPVRDRSLSEPIGSYMTDIVGGVVLKTPDQPEYESTDDDLDSSDDEAQVNLSHQSAIKTGYCVKQGFMVKNWKRRFFVLTHEALSYYKNEQNWRDPNKAAIKNICLNKILEARESVGVHPGRDNLFEVVTSQRVFYIQCDTPDERQHWIRQVNETVTKSCSSKMKNDAGCQTSNSLTRGTDPVHEHSMWV